MPEPDPPTDADLEKLDIGQLAEEIAQEATQLREAADQIESGEDPDPDQAALRVEIEKRLKKVDESIERLRKTARSG